MKSNLQEVGMLMRRSGLTRWGRDSTGADFTAESLLKGGFDPVGPFLGFSFADLRVSPGSLRDFQSPPYWVTC